MKTEVKVNVPASVFARLKNLAREREIDVDLILTRYVIERLLYRLGQSEERNNFILKGAMLFTVWTGQLYRPSRDLDLLVRGDGAVDAMVRRVRGICRTAVSVDDGVTFDIDGIEGEEIRSADEYRGVRIHVPAKLGSVRKRIQVDIGVGDPAPGNRDGDYPTLLDLPAPNVRMYSREAVVAEKFEAIVSLGAGNSRMKDFADLFVLQRDFAFDGPVLSRAIAKTFERRRTALPEQIPVGLTTEWAGTANQEKMWRAFLRRADLERGGEAFADVVDRLQAFLLPAASAARRATAFDRDWVPGSRTWRGRGR